MLDLVCLRSFVHVCERGTIAAAAADLGYTAPAVSQHIAKLERDVGVAVFDRVGGRLRPSAAGNELLAMAASMLDLEERCRGLATTRTGGCAANLSASERACRSPCSVSGRSVRPVC